MTNNNPNIDALRDSFNRVYHGPNRLQREYDLQKEAKRMGMLIEDYRQLYELRDEEEIDPYPQQKWWKKPRLWIGWFWGLPKPKKLTLAGKGGFWLLKQGFFITVAVGTIRYITETDKRQKLAHYQAWQMINSATGQKTSGGRIEALQDLNKDKVSLGGLDASEANLSGIKLQNAKLWNSNFSGSNLNDVNLSGVNLNGANLSNATLIEAKLSNATLIGAKITGAMLGNANFGNADLGCIKHCTNFKGAKDITPEQIKKAKNWQSACYDPDFRIKLGLPPQNPKQCAGEQPTK